MTGAAFPVNRPTGAALLSRLAATLMDVTLHLGAHRTGTTTFQHFTRHHADELGAQGIGYWGPVRTRKSVFPGLFGGPGLARRRTGRAEGRVRLQTEQAEQRGYRQLLVSDENMLGPCLQGFRQAALYPGAGERLARLGAAFGHRVSRVVLSIRAQDLWWASASAQVAARGHRIPGPDRYAAIARSPRSWRDVITDIACALPRADIRVLPFETFAGRPEQVLRAATGLDLPPEPQMRWLNRSLPLPDLRAVLRDSGGDPTQLPRGQGRWQPFTETQAAALRETYADDMHWLKAGADGLATLTETETRTEAGPSLTRGEMMKGHRNEQGHMAQHR